MNLALPRDNAASTFANYSIFISGGSPLGSKSSKTIEMVFDAGLSLMGPELPEAIADHCMVTLDFRGSYEQVWIIGGRTKEGSSYKTQIHSGNDWVRGPDLIYARQEHACAVIKSEAFGNQELIIVAGGRDEMFGDNPFSSVEFHVSGTQYWYRGKFSQMTI